MRPPTCLVGPFGLVPTENIGKPSSSISRLSREAASITTPARPSFLAALIMIAPINAQVWSPLPSITSTSPGLASDKAAWIIRLSPGRTSTVKAVPASVMFGRRARMRPCMAPRRPATSAKMAGWNWAACLTMSALTRGKSLMMSGRFMVSFLSEYGWGVG